jgi:uncharacterized protein YbjT (DUF2867 family)
VATEPHTQRIVLVAGATGLVGRECLRLLANDSEIEEVRALVRRPLPPECNGPRIRECRTDFERLSDHPDWFQVDWVFCVLGTTMAKAGSRAAFQHVDYEYPLAIAKAALAQGASHVLLVSAMGANPRSPFFYYRVKGELEDAVHGLGCPSLTIARPALLLGDRSEWRAGEEFAKRAAWMLPERWRPVHASQVASALVRAAHGPVFGTLILENAVLRTYQMPDAIGQKETTHDQHRIIGPP